MRDIGSFRRGAVAACLALLAALLLAAAPSSAGASPERAGQPEPLLGVVAQTDYISRGEVRRMRRAGVGSVRFLIPWGRIEKQPGVYKWGLIDERMLAIAHSRAIPMATVFGSPRSYGDTQPPTSSAAEMQAWLDFLEALIGRYGPGGRFIEAHPGVEPLQRWQVWNEPNLTAFWGELEPSPPAYVRLLDRSAAAIRAADPGATVIAAGLSPAARGLDPDSFLAGMYEQWRRLGVEPSFDELALHPYAESVEQTKRLVEQSLAVARRAGYPRPRTTIAEIAWGSAGPPGYPLAGTPRSQAAKLRDAYDLFARKAKNWNLAAVYWYSLRDLPEDVDACGFCDFTGLLDDRGRPKPAWKAFQDVVRSERRTRARRAAAADSISFKTDQRIARVLLELHGARGELRSALTVAPTDEGGVRISSDRRIVDTSPERECERVSGSELLCPPPTVVAAHLGPGEDRLTVETPRNPYFPGYPRSRVYGGPGADLIAAGRGSDRLEGGAGRDRILGGRGNDDILGGRGADALLGGRSSDDIDALDGGADHLIACGPGYDFLGRDGADPRGIHCESSDSTSPLPEGRRNG